MSSDIPSPITNPQARGGASAPQTIIVQSQPSAAYVVWGRLGWIGFFICGAALLSYYLSVQSYFDTVEGITEKHHSGTRTATDKIAILTISGAIMGGDGYAKKQIDQILSDEQIKGVVLRIDSPGGTVTGSDYILHHLKKMREKRIKQLDEAEPGVKHDFPVVVSMGSMAASGGYYVAMAVGDQPQSIYAEPTCSTGSIGVMLPRYDITGLMDEWKVKDDTLATHPRKLMGSMSKPLPPEERARIQKSLDESLVRFKEIIKEGRPYFKENPDKLDELATGEVFSAPQAKEHRLIDEIGFIEEAIERVAELAALEENAYRVVEYESPGSLYDSLMSSGASADAEAISLAALQKLSTPQAYYLYTNMPLLAPLAKEE
jgi:protease-4